MNGLIRLEEAAGSLANIPRDCPLIGGIAEYEMVSLLKRSLEALIAWNDENPTEPINACIARDGNEGDLRACDQYVAGNARLCGKCETRAKAEMEQERLEAAN